ncbi:MAG: cbb3-type cytochrome c oxidase subunit II [Verrucomicrobiota bacterium]|nr:cbb3-type cytochrome c oxidase subunit II [Verrucomicrobiota bacterium]
MNQGSILFLSVFGAMALSWGGFVMLPQVQLGSQSTRVVKEIGRHYPAERGGLAERGRDIYRAAGCVSCHTQQVRQSGYEFDLVLTKAGDFTELVTSLVSQANTSLTPQETAAIVGNAPTTILEGVGKSEVDRVLHLFKDSGAKVAANIRPLGPDIERGWGPRQTVGLDYLFDQPVLLGSQRIGPDLVDVGSRLTDRKWHLLHLYHPHTVQEGSIMPAYPYLFETKKILSGPSSDALALEGDFSPPEGMEVVPTPEANALVDYLLSLRIQNPVFEAPYMFTQDQGSDDNNSQMEQPE